MGAVLGGPGQGRPEEPFGDVGAALVDVLDDRSGVDRGGDGRAHGGVGQGSGGGVEVDADGPGGGGVLEPFGVEGGDLGVWDGLDDVGLAGAEGGDAGGGVGDVVGVETVHGGRLAPVVIVAFHGRAGGGGLGDAEGTGG